MSTDRDGHRRGRSLSVEDEIERGLAVDIVLADALARGEVDTEAAAQTLVSAWGIRASEAEVARILNGRRMSPVPEVGRARERLRSMQWGLEVGLALIDVEPLTEAMARVPSIFHHPGHRSDLGVVSAEGGRGTLVVADSRAEGVMARLGPGIVVRVFRNMARIDICLPEADPTSKLALSFAMSALGFRGIDGISSHDDRPATWRFVHHDQVVEACQVMMALQTGSSTRGITSGSVDGGPGDGPATRDGSRLDASR